MNMVENNSVNVWVRQFASKTTVIGSLALIIVLLNTIRSIPYVEYVVLFSILLFVLTIGIGGYSPSAFRLLREPAHAEKPSLLILLLPSLSPLIYWLSSDWEIKEILMLFFYTIVVALLLCWLVMRTSKKHHPKEVSEMMMGGMVFVFLLGVAYGILVFINCIDDFSSDEHQVLVVDKVINSDSDQEMYYLILKSMKKDFNQTQIAVDEDFFDQTEKGALLDIKSREGNLGIEWFSIVR